MGVFGSTASSNVKDGSALSTVSEPNIQNVALPSTKGTEASFTLPLGTIRYKFRSRTNSKLQYAYVATESDTTYITIDPGNWEVIGDVNAQRPLAITIYVQSTKADDVVEVLSWT